MSFSLNCKICNKRFRRQNPNMVVIEWNNGIYCSEKCMQKDGYRRDGQLEL